MARRTPKNSQNEPFKPHAIKVAEAARARVMKDGVEDYLDVEGSRLAEIQQWKNHVVDLHRVISVSQAMYLLLEHNNEALLRIAIEIITCPDVQKVLWWDERWYYNDEMREWFRKQVKLKLGRLMTSMEISVPMEEEKEEEEDDHKYQELTKKVEGLENARNAAVKGQQAAEHQLREKEEDLRESKSYAKEIEKNLETLRKELKEQLANTPKEIPPDVRADLEKSQQQVRLLEEQKKTVEEKLAKVVEDMNRSASMSDLEKARAEQAKLTSRIEEEKGKVKELESEVRVLKSRLEMEQNKPRDKPAPQKMQAAAPAVKEVVKEKIVVDHGAQEELAAMKHSFAEEQRRAQEFQDEADRLRQAHEAESAKVAQLEAKNGTLKRQIASLETDTLDLKSKLAHALNRPDAPPAPPSPVVKERPKPTPLEPAPASPKPERESPPAPTSPTTSPTRSRQTGVPEEEHYKVLDKLEKAKERIGRMRDEITQLTQEKDGFESKNGKLLKMLHQIKEQLKRMTEIAEKKGFGNVVQSILEEANVSETLNSPEYTAFDRLYEDAKRRQERNRMLQEVKLGIRPKEDIPVFDRRSSRLGSGAVDLTALQQQHTAREQRRAARKAARMRMQGVGTGGGASERDDVSRSSIAEGYEGSSHDSDSNAPILCERCGRSLEATSRPNSAVYQGGGWQPHAAVVAAHARIGPDGMSWNAHAAVGGQGADGNPWNASAGGPYAGGYRGVSLDSNAMLRGQPQSTVAPRLAEASVPGAWGHAPSRQSTGADSEGWPAGYNKAPSYGKPMSRAGSETGSRRSSGTGVRVQQPKRAISPPAQHAFETDLLQIQGQSRLSGQSGRGSGSEHSVTGGNRPSSSAERHTTPMEIASNSQQQATARPSSPTRQVWTGRAASTRSPSPGRQSASGRSQSPTGHIEAAMSISSHAEQRAPVRPNSSSSQDGHTALIRPNSSSSQGSRLRDPVGPAGFTAPIRVGQQDSKLRRTNSQPIRIGPTGDEAGISKQRSLGNMKPGMTIQGKGLEDSGNSRREFHRQMPDVILGPHGMSYSPSSPSGSVSAMALDLQVHGTPTPKRDPKRSLYRSRSQGAVSKKDEVADSDLGDSLKAGTIRDGPPHFRGKKLGPGKVTAMFHSMPSVVGTGPKKQMSKAADVEKQAWHKEVWDEKQMWKASGVAPNLLSLGQTTYIYAGGVRPIPTTDLTPGWGSGWESVPAKQASDFPPAKEL